MYEGYKPLTLSKRDVCLKHYPHEMPTQTRQFKKFAMWQQACSVSQHLPPDLAMHSLFVFVHISY